MDMKKMMKQAQKMQLEAARAQEEITQMEFEATTGGGMVKVVAMGDMSIKSVSIDPEAVDPEDVALRSATEATNQRMNAVMGGMKIPGLM